MTWTTFCTYPLRARTYRYLFERRPLQHAWCECIDIDVKPRRTSWSTATRSRPEFISRVPSSLHARCTAPTFLYNLATFLLCDGDRNHPLHALLSVCSCHLLSFESREFSGINRTRPPPRSLYSQACQTSMALHGTHRLMTSIHSTTCFHWIQHQLHSDLLYPISKQPTTLRASVMLLGFVSR